MTTIDSNKMELFLENIFRKGWLLPAIIALFASCEKKIHFDFPGDPDNRIFLSTAGTPVKHEYLLTHTPIGTMGNVSLKIAAGSTKPEESVVKVALSVDNSLIADYNNERGTEFQAVPDGLLQVSNTVLTIPAKGTGTADSLEITINEADLPDLTAESGYLIPIRIASVEGNGTVSINRNVVYAQITVSVDYDNIWDLASESDIVGQRVEDRSLWTAEAVEIPLQISGNVSSLFDGLESNQSRWRLQYDGSASVVFDMGATYAGIGGLYINAMIAGSTLFTSVDGSTWEEQGTVSSTNSSIAFYSPVEARYVKWTTNVQTTGNYYINGYEFNAYINE